MQYEVQIVGPVPVGGTKVLWLVIVFDERGQKIGTIDAMTEAEAYEIKERLARAFRDDGAP